MVTQWADKTHVMCTIPKRVVTLMHDGPLEKGMHDWMHVLGTGKLEWAGVLTAISTWCTQTVQRKLYN